MPDIPVPAPSERLAFYRRQLLDDIVPFWEKHGPDPATGALRTCIADDGRALAERFYLWSQLRALWTFSALARRIEARDRWRRIAAGIYRFCRAHGRDGEGRWVFCVGPDGAVLEGPTSIYADGFAMMGLTEYFRLTGDGEALALALETCENVRRRLATPGGYRTAPYDIPPGTRAHGISMIFSVVFHELGRAAGRPDIADEGRRHVDQVLDGFLRPETGYLHEYVTLDNRLYDAPLGRAVVPGHAIECMWFLIHVLRERGEAAAIARTLPVIRRHLELGWDPEYGGLFLGADAAGGESAWENWDKKVWWPHTEALYALTLAREHTDEPWVEEWYRRVHAYSFRVFPDPVNGEWTQRCDRQGRRMTEYVALPVKDPFHWPRAVILMIESLARQFGTDSGTP